MSKNSESMPRSESEIEQEMMDATHRTLDLSRQVPFGEDPVTGIDVRNTGYIEKGIRSNEKDSLALYPADDDPVSKMYLRSQKTGGVLSRGRSTRAYITKSRGGKRHGQHVQVTTDYESKGDERYPKGSKTNVTVWDDEGNVIRERDHQSEGTGLSPLVTKIVTTKMNEQIQKVKDGDKSQQPITGTDTDTWLEDQKRVWSN